MKSWSRMSLRSAAVLMVFAVIGCSPGGGGSSGPTAPPGTPNPAQVEFDSFALVNVARDDNGVEPPVGFRDDLAAVARRHSERMRDEGFFGHADGAGRTVGDRLAAAGIAFQATGENLAMTTNIANPAVWAHDQLMASADHRPNILNTDFLAAGVGVARAGNTYWITQVFIRP